MTADVLLREQLVERLVGAGHIRTAQVAEAFRAVPRHLFLPDVESVKAYADEAIPTKWDRDGRPISSSSQPAIMVAMLEQLGVEPGHHVLEIGAGTGYNAALMAYLVGESGAVTTVDIDEDLVGQARVHLAEAGYPDVTVVCADGAVGAPENGPYDRMILTVGAWDLAPAWLEQLADGGRLVLPLSLRGMQRSVAFERSGDHLASVSIVNCGFMPLRGALADPEPARPLGDQTGLFLKLGDERTVDAAALCAALGQPGQRVPLGVSVTPADVMGGLGLWLAMLDADVGQLSAFGAAADRSVVPALVRVPGMSLTTVLVGDSGLAALARPDEDSDSGSTLAAQSFGPADDLARRLAAHVRAWDRQGRPSTAELRIRAYPRDAMTDDTASMVIDKRHTRLLIDW